MKILAISGSPRVGGNTDSYLKHILNILDEKGIETEFITLAGKQILSCKACAGCTKGPECVQKDDFGDIFDKMAAADGFILGSPVYFSTASAEMTALLDRAGYVAKMNGSMFDRKIGGAVAVARRAGTNFTLAQLLMWCAINGMVVPGSSYWTVGFGRKVGEAMDDTEGVQTMTDFADNIAWLCEKLGN